MLLQVNSLSFHMIKNHLLTTDAADTWRAELRSGAHLLCLLKTCQRPSHRTPIYAYISFPSVYHVCCECIMQCRRLVNIIELSPLCMLLLPVKRSTVVVVKFKKINSRLSRPIRIDPDDTDTSTTDQSID